MNVKRCEMMPPILIQFKVRSEESIRNKTKKRQKFYKGIRYLLHVTTTMRSPEKYDNYFLRTPNDRTPKVDAQRLRVAETRRFAARVNMMIE
jgi:hypothetical protein